MDLPAIRSLCTLADTHSLSETARLVHLTPAAIHKQLKRLEEELNVTLYAKGEEGLVLTAAALVILPYLRNMLGQEASALSVLEQWRGMGHGLLRVGAGPSLANDFLPAILLRFHAAFPAIDVDVQTGTSQYLLAGLESGSLDVAILVSGGELELPMFQVELEHSVELFVVSALDKLPVRTSLRRLAEWPFLFFRRGSRVEAILSSYCNRWNFEPKSIMRFDNPSTLKAMLLGKVGVGMLPSYTVAQELKTGQLKRICLREEPPVMKVRVLSCRSTFAPPSVSAFLGILKKMLA